MLIIQSEKLIVKTKHFVDNNGTPTFQHRIPLPLQKYFGGRKHLYIKLTGKIASMTAEISRHKKATDRMFQDLQSKNGMELLELEAIGT